jgi:hypothetical protein
MIVSFRVIWINVDRVDKLDRRLVVPAFLEIMLPALKIFLLANLRITGAGTRHNTKEDGDGDWPRYPSEGHASQASETDVSNTSGYDKARTWQNATNGWLPTDE